MHKKEEQMTIVMRFVDKSGHVKEQFIDLVHVKDTTAATLKRDLYVVLFQHDIDISNICCQGYDGTSNMRGEWNELQALFLSDNAYDYYVHCFAHRLQLVLVSTSREVILIHKKKSILGFIVNIMCSSSKYPDELQDVELDEMSKLLELGEFEIGKGKNQMDTLKIIGDIHWSSHFQSICSMLKLYNASCSILQNIIIEGSTYSQRGMLMLHMIFWVHIDFTYNESDYGNY